MTERGTITPVLLDLTSELKIADSYPSERAALCTSLPLPARFGDISTISLFAVHQVAERIPRATPSAHRSVP